MKTCVRIFCIFMILLAGTFGVAKAQNLSVKTNGLMLGAGFPNVGMELVTGSRTSLEFSAFGGYKPYTLDIKMFGLQPEFKFWLSGRALTREYVGVTLLGVTYDMKIKNKSYKGDAAGLGLTVGYSIPLNARCNIEFSAGVGGYLFRQVRHSVNDNENDYIEQGYDIINSKGFKLLPSKLAVSISYILK